MLSVLIQFKMQGEEKTWVHNSSHILVFDHHLTSFDGLKSCCEETTSYKSNIAWFTGFVGERSQTVFCDVHIRYLDYIHHTPNVDKCLVSLAFSPPSTLAALEGAIRVLKAFTEKVPALRWGYVGLYGGFPSHGGYPKSSIYRWIFHLGNHPAIGVSPFQETSIYEYAPCCPEPGNRDAWTKRCPRWLVSRASASKCPMGWGFEKGYYPSYMWWWNMGFNVV
jgi:hypothetical protein